MKRLPKLEVYRAADGWRWRYQAANGKVMADSGEAYVERNKCLRAMCEVFNLIPSDVQYASKETWRWTRPRPNDARSSVRIRVEGKR